MSKMSSSAFSAAAIVDSNDDVLTEILLGLPAKTLTRFKSVSKHWFSLISADQFRRRHTRRHPKPQPSLILLTSTSEFFYFHPILNFEKLIPYNFTIPNPKIWSCCNGLLLLQSGEDYFVYNPTTKQSRNITLTNNDKYTNVVGLNLAFDPSKSLHYKIVCVRIPMRRSVRRRCQIEVYDSESHSWELCLEPFPLSIQVEFCFGVYCNNAIYWRVSNNSIFFFDIDKKVIGSLNSPLAVPLLGDSNVVGVFHFPLLELNGYLYHIVTVQQEFAITSLAIYELQERCSEWLLKYHGGFDVVKYIKDFDILSLDGGHNGETHTLLTHVPGKLISYRTLDKSSVELDLTDQSFYDKDDLPFFSRDVYKFGESLVPV